MALPKLTAPEYEMELPSTSETIKYRPFLVKEQKLLLIAQESSDDKQISSAMGKLVSECTFGKIDAKFNPMFDIEYAFLKIRGKSVGETVELELICPDDEETSVKQKINIDDIVVQIKDDHSTEIALTDDISIDFRYPLIADMENLSELAPSQIVFKLLANCVTSIRSGDEVHQKTDMSKKELDDFIDSFSNEQFEKVTNFFDTMPKIRHTVEITNPKTKVKSEVVLEGLENFLG